MTTRSSFGSIRAGVGAGAAGVVAAAADFGNGISNVLGFDTHLFVNTDLSVQRLRPPMGEWVLLDARTEIDPSGVGQAVSQLYDERGHIGTAAQTLFVSER